MSSELLKISLGLDMAVYLTAAGELTFRPIVLFNMLGKLIDKIITKQLQFYTVKYSILYSN